MPRACCGRRTAARWRWADDPDADLPYAQRHAAHPAEKRAIARAAAATIRPGQVIALDPSTTACHLARLIPDQPLTVVTNSIVVCTLLAEKPRVEVICTGGTLDPEAMAFFGLGMAASLEKLNVERLFFSCKGVDLDRGLSEANDRHAAAKLALIAAARSRTLLVDTSKLGQPANRPLRRHRLRRPRESSRPPPPTPPAPPSPASARSAPTCSKPSP